jgi:hypothetical protein
MNLGPEAPDKICVEYCPPPPVPPGKFVVKAPHDKRGHPCFPTLHLTPQEAFELWVALGNAIEDELRNKEKDDAESRLQGDAAD